jgi:hypothetical protein
MGIIYHGSKYHGIKRLEPKTSTHGDYVYGTNDKTLALTFGSRCGDDLTYEIGHFDEDKNGPWELVELIPLAFDKMFSNSSSIYSISDETFKDINTGFNELVSEVGVDVISEEYIDNLYDEIIKAEQEGLIKIYRYPNRPLNFSQDDTLILDKWRYYKETFNKEFNKHEFDRLVFLHPNLLDKINELAKEFNYDYHYDPNDLVSIFDLGIQTQLHSPEHEVYVDSAYISICNTYPELKDKIDSLYEEYTNNNRTR